jgi:hypothetical protein
LNLNRIVTVTEDRRTMTIEEDGFITTLDSRRPEGFTDADVQYAYNEYQPPCVVTAGEVRRVRRVAELPTGGLYLHVNTGPPTWWRPRTVVERTGGGWIVGAGWYRALIMLSWRRRETQ